ncbi:holin [Mycobacterium phage Terror]|uniref:Holin n=1 Tax=Mycobacterium phage Taheera TaxID=1897549 RepID=A0A1D8EVR3_9CAUD|nr:holin [Mycobacterium phage Taheera]AOT25140.1 holin [Mycobacterium phage Taheera]AOT25200.1 holin [Mycobacterium phage Terror]
MLSKYSPAQKAKATAALLSSLVLFLGAFGAFVADVLPTGSGAAAAIAAGIAVVCAVLVRTATFLTTSAPTLDQIAKNLDETIELVREVQPAAIAPRYGRHVRNAGDADDAGDDESTS